MWKMKSTNETFFENYIYPVLAVNSILKEGNYSTFTGNREQKIKVTLDGDNNIFLMEIKLKEQESNRFIKSLKYHKQTKHIPILMETKLKTQFFWDKYNLQELNGNLEKSGKEYPWLVIKINTKNSY